MLKNRGVIVIIVLVILLIGAWAYYNSVQSKQKYNQQETVSGNEKGEMQVEVLDPEQ